MTLTFNSEGGDCTRSGGDMVKVCAKYGRPAMKTIWFGAVWKTLTWLQKNFNQSPMSANDLDLELGRWGRAHVMGVLYSVEIPHGTLVYTCTSTIPTWNISTGTIPTRKISVHMYRYYSHMEHQYTPLLKLYLHVFGCWLNHILK
jgi:hypothetical protein